MVTKSSFSFSGLRLKEVTPNNTYRGFFLWRVSVPDLSSIGGFRFFETRQRPMMFCLLLFNSLAFYLSNYIKQYFTQYFTIHKICFSLVTCQRIRSRSYLEQVFQEKKTFAHKWITNTWMLNLLHITLLNTFWILLGANTGGGAFFFYGHHFTFWIFGILTTIILFVSRRKTNARNDDTLHYKNTTFFFQALKTKVGHNDDTFHITL